MTQFNSPLIKPWGFRSNNRNILHNPYHNQAHTRKNLDILPEHIVPQQHASDLLKRMAYKASKKYDRREIISTPSPTSYTTTVAKTTKPPESNSEVLFLPGSQSTNCNEKVAKSGKCTHLQRNIFEL